jgi:nucleoside-diphosphate-sugar epimerase
MKILVIGNGFIAAPIIQKLESQGHHLAVFSRTFKDETKSRQFIGDIFHFEELVKALRWDPQAIIHTAWVATHGIYENDPINYKFAQFTLDLATWISRSKVQHLIILGSGAEYGTRNMASAAGTTGLNPENLYAKQKVFAFNSTKEILRNSDVRLSWVRIFKAYGPGQDKKRLLPYMIDAVKNNELIRLDDTSTVLDWVTTEDIAGAISWLINNDTPIEVDIGTTIGFTNVELLRHLEGLLGDTHQWTRFVEKNSNKSHVYLVGKESPLFKSGWRPRDTLDSGLKRILGL